MKMKSNMSFHNSGVCEELQASIIRFFEENYAATCDVEIDAIICLSLLDTSDQNVIKIHKVLPKHLFKFSSNTLPQVSYPQDPVSKRFPTLKIPTLRPSPPRRRKPLKVNISRKICKTWPVLGNKFQGNLNNSTSKICHLQNDSESFQLPEQDNGELLSKGQGNFGVNNKQQYILDDIHLNNTVIKKEPEDSGFEFGNSKNKKTEVNDKELVTNENEILQNTDLQKEHSKEIMHGNLLNNSVEQEALQMSMFITNEGTVLKEDDECEEDMMEESFVEEKDFASSSHDADSYYTSGGQGDSTGSRKFEDEILLENGTGAKKRKSMKSLDYIVLQHRSGEHLGNSLQDGSNTDQLHQGSSLSDQYDSFNSQFYGQGHSDGNYAKPFLIPESYKRKQNKPRKLNKGTYNSSNLPSQIELGGNGGNGCYDNTGKFEDEDDRLFTSSFMKVLDSAPQRLNLRLDNSIPGSPAEKKFFCDKCGTGFSSKKSKLRHEKHTCGTRSFPCSICSKTFSRADSKQRHIWKVHGIKVVSHSQMSADNYGNFLQNGMSIQSEENNYSNYLQSEMPQQDDGDSFLCETQPGFEHKNINQRDDLDDVAVDRCDVNFQESLQDSQDIELGSDKCLVDFTQQDSSSTSPQDDTNGTESTT